MSLSTNFICEAITAIHQAVVSNKDAIESLDQAIGDGDHYINLLRGSETIAGMTDALQDQSPDAVLNTIGMKLLSTIGGASGPLFASFFMGMSQTLKQNGGQSEMDIAVAFAAGVQMLIKRGKGQVGDKTMLDVLVPVAHQFIYSAIENKDAKTIAEDLVTTANTGLESTRDMVAKKGRASGLGDRSIGHLDAGAKSCQVMIESVCNLI